MTVRAPRRSMVEFGGGALGVLTLLAFISWLAYAGVALLSRQFVAEQPFTQRPILAVLGLLGAAFACYLVAIFVVVRTDDDEVEGDGRRLLWLIVLSSVVFRVTLLFSWPIQEVDAYRYLWDGAAATCGVSPYRYSPQQVLAVSEHENLPDDLRRLAQLRDSSPAMATVLSRIHYEELPTVYPPVSQAVFAACTLLTPPQASVLQRLVIMKACFVLFDLFTLVLVIALLHCVGQHIGWSLVYGWCPLVMKEIANSGHLDSVAVFLTTSAVLVTTFVLYRDGGVGGFWRLMGWATLTAALLALAVGAKLYPIVLLPLFAVVWIRRLGWRLAAAPTAAFVVLVVALLWPMIPWGDARTLVRSRSTLVNELAIAPSEEAIARQPQDPSRGLKAVLGRWEINDLLFLTLVENIKPRGNTLPGERPWFAIVPDGWRLKLLKSPTAWLRLDAASAAVLLARLMVAAVFVVLAVALARRAARSDYPEVWLRAAMLTLAWFWLLSPTQNPWYWIWVLPLVPFARSKAWLAVSGLTLAYYLRFWLSYHWPEGSVLGTGYPGTLFFDYVVTWLEFGPWFAWLAIDAWRFQRKRGGEASGAYREYGDPPSRVGVGFPST